MRRTALRALACAFCVVLVALWFRFLAVAFTQSTGGVPAPGAFMVTLLFASVAIGGGVAALRDVPVAVALTGLLSFLPVGLYLMMFPGPTRWIGVLDLGLIAVGVALMRSEVSLPEEEPRSPDSGPPPWP